MFVSAVSWSTQASTSSFDHSHALLSEVLNKYVIEKGMVTQVDYKKLKIDRAKLDNYLGLLAVITKASFADFSKNNQLAFLINAYNAYTLRFIIDHYPVKTIRDLGEGGLFGSGPWKRKLFDLFGEKVHLDHIEHDLIRKKFKEPRIHFAVNCASVGCPSLLREAYEGDKLEEQLEVAARRFIHNPEHNRYDIEGGTLYLSKIFDWYGDDFKLVGGKQSYVARTLSLLPKYKTHKQSIEKSPVHYVTYDWNLNEVK